MEKLKFITFSLDAHHICGKKSSALSRKYTQMNIGEKIKKSCFYDTLKNSVKNKLYDVIALNIIHDNFFIPKIGEFLTLELKNVGYDLKLVSDYISHKSEINEEEWRGVSLYIYQKSDLTGNDNEIVYTSKYHMCKNHLIHRGGILVKMNFTLKDISFGFLSVHLPFNTHYINTISFKDTSYHLEETPETWNHCLNEIFNKLVFNENLDGLIVIADQNYPLTCSNNEMEHHIKNMNISEFREHYDYLYYIMKKGEIPTLVEGVSGKGPSHLPYRKEPQGNPKSNKRDIDRNWYDRIFYQVYSKNNKKQMVEINCLEYDTCTEKENMNIYSSTYSIFDIYM